MVHFHIPVEEDEGIYHFRLYSYNEQELYDTGFGSDIAQGKLYAHAKACKSTPAIELHEDIVKSWSPIKTAKENEMELGIPSFDNYSLTLAPDKRLEQLVKKIREIDQGVEIWIAVTLEQRAEDIPASNPGSGFLWPRKERLKFWGKLMPHEASGRSINEELKTKPQGEGLRDEKIAHMPSVERVALRDHSGEFSMSFKHWFNTKCEEHPKQWLDLFKLHNLPEAGGEEISLAVLLADLMRYLSPTKLVAMSDKRLIRNEGIGVPFDQTVHGANFLLPMAIGDATSSQSFLRFIYVNYKTGGTYYPVFVYEEDEHGQNDSGEFSLYSIDTLGELFVRFAREIKLFPQHELPTFDEVLSVPKHASLDNHYLQLYWSGATRWLFLPANGGPLSIHVDPHEDAIDYQPAASYLRKCRVEMPSGEDQLPFPAWTEIEHTWAEGDSMEYKTLFRFRGIEYVGGVPTLSSRGYELKFKESLLDAMGYADRVLYGDDNATFDNWATFHAAYEMSIWGRVSAKYTLTSKSSGIEPFGASATVGLQQMDELRKVYGMLDFGEFPLLRYCDFEIGLMPEGELIRAVVYECAQTPGGDVEASFIEVGTIISPDDPGIGGPGLPPPPENPREKETPVITTPTGATPIIGTIPIVVDAGDPPLVAGVKIYIDDVFHDMLPGSTGSTYSFTLDTTTLSTGAHTIKAVCVFTDGTTDFDTQAITKPT